MPRGRPKGSKNKVKSSTSKVTTGKKRGRPAKTDNKFVLGEIGESFMFPIVQEETVKKPVAFLTVKEHSFRLALGHAIHWAKVYSAERNASYWPLVKYAGIEKRYVKRISGVSEELAYAENHDVGSWLHVSLLGVV